MNSCKFCGTKFESERGLHGHIKAHDITLPEYYQKYYPRKDKLTGENISFKNKAHYFRSSFNNHENMIKWIKTAAQEEVKAFVLKELTTYASDLKEKYNSTICPSQIDFKAVLGFSIRLIEAKLRVSFEDLLDEVDVFDKRYDYGVSSIRFKECKNFVIAQDTREQNPLVFKDIKVVSQKLDFGDYVPMRENYAGIYIERKSLADLVSTISLGLNRFKSELNRAKETGGYLVVVVEDTIKNALQFDKKIPSGSKIKATPDFIFHRIRELMRDYKNVQFLFVNGREEASLVIPLIFRLKKTDIESFDMQYLYDKELL